MEELYLNDVLVDFEQGSASLTKQINNIAEVKDRQVGYSNSITLPFTPVNIELMDMLGVAGNTSKKPYQKISVRYVVYGVELIVDGVGEIKQTSKGYQLNIYDNTKDLFSKLKNLTLQDLDFSAYNQVIDADIVVGSKNNTSGFIYALADFYAGANSGYFLEAFAPSFFCHTLMDMIITQAGYTYSGAIFSDADFKSRVYPMTKGVTKSITNNDIITTDLDLTESTGAPIYINETDLWATVGGTDYVKLIHTENCDIGDKFRLEIDPNVLLTKTWGTDYRIGIDYGLGIDLGVGFYYDETFTGTLLLAQATTIKFYIVTAYEQDGSNGRVMYNTNFNIKYTNLNSESFPITFENEIGDLGQLDFVKEMMQRYGLISRRVSNSTEYEFIQMKALLNDKANAVDYSGNYSDFISESYKAPYSKSNCFKHQYDKGENDEEKTWADGVFEINNFHLPEEKIVLTSKMIATDFVISERFSEDFGVNLTVDETNPLLLIKNYKYYQIGTLGELDYEIGFEPIDNKPRIFKLENRIKAESFLVQAGSSYVTTTNESLPYLVFDGCDYQTELENNYQEFVSLIFYYKRLMVNMNLSVVDYKDLDLFKLTFLEQFGKYFYINKVSNFRKGKATKVELIQVNDKMIKFDSTLVKFDSSLITFDKL